MVKVEKIVVIGLVLALLLSGCTTPNPPEEYECEDGTLVSSLSQCSENTEDDTQPTDIPFPDPTGEGEEPPELPF